MRPSDDAVFDAVFERIGRKIQASLKLVRLDAGESKQRRALPLLQLFQVGKVRPDVLVDDLSFDSAAFQLCRRHATAGRESSRSA